MNTIWKYELEFEIIHNDSEVVIKTFNNLKECIKYIRLTINNVRAYHINEVENGEIVNTSSAYYLLENYKDLSKLPLSLFDC